MISQKETLAQQKIATQQRLAAIEERKKAEQALDQTFLNRSKYLAGLANVQIDQGDVGTGLLLALEALPDYPILCLPQEGKI